MFTYEFRCPNNHIFESTIHASTLVCDCGEVAKRIYTPFMQARVQIEPQWNPSLGQYVTSEKDMKSKFGQLSDEHSERLGQTVNYQPVDLSEPASIGVTEEGLDSTRRREHNQKAK